MALSDPRMCVDICALDRQPTMGVQPSLPGRECNRIPLKGDTMFGLEGFLGTLLAALQEVFVSGILGFITDLIGQIFPAG